MTVPSYPLRWFIHFHFSTATWFDDKAEMARMLDAFASSPWFGELDHFGIGGKPGVRFSAVDEVRMIVTQGMRGQYAFARGDAAATAAPEMAEAAFVFDVRPQILMIRANATGGVLARLGPRALDDVIAGTVSLAEAWRGRGWVAAATAAPGGELMRTRLQPPRRSLRPLAAVVDIVDPTLPASAVAPQQYEVQQAIAKATPPAGVERSTQAGLVVDRWLPDPSDETAIADASNRHAAWVASIVELPVAE